MNTQPTALRLAEKMEGYRSPHCGDAAAELRHLHALNQELLEALKEYGDHYDGCPQYPTYAEPENYPPCNCGYEAAIAKAGEQK